MTKIAVVYWSGTGNTETMANCIIEGLKAGGANASLFSVANFNVATLDDYDKIAFGCPAMGAEELEPDEFEPMWESIEDKLSGRKIALFGSYEWADGEWMQTWQERAKEKGANLFEEGITAYDSPDEEAQEKCRSFGERFAK